jgi:hypothetical protein
VQNITAVKACKALRLALEVKVNNILEASESGIEKSC